MAKHAAKTSAPVETKVALQAGGGTLGAAISAFVTWILGVTVWGVPFTADRATDAMGAVPLPVSGLLAALLTIGLGAYAGYKAPHTQRPDLTDTLHPVESSNLPAPVTLAEQDSEGADGTMVCGH